MFNKILGAEFSILWLNNKPYKKPAVAHYKLLHAELAAYFCWFLACLFL